MIYDLINAFPQMYIWIVKCKKIIKAKDFNIPEVYSLYAFISQSLLKSSKSDKNISYIPKAVKEFATNLSFANKHMIQEFLHT